LIVIDSSLLIAALSRKDANHRRAQGLLAEIRKGLWGRALVPEYIFVEVTNWVHRRFGREAALRFVRSLGGTDDAKVVPCSPIFDRALAIYTRTAAGNLSFADAGLVAVAEKHGVQNVATFDQGYRAFPGLNIIQAPRFAA